MVGPSGIQSLPNELLDNIFGFLESTTPAVSRLQSNPAEFLRKSSPHQELKAVSLVSKRWREVASQYLFSHLVWHVDKASLHGIELLPDRTAAIPPLRFVRDKKLAPRVDSITIIVGDQPHKPPSGDILLSDFAPEKRRTFDNDMNWLWTTLLQDIDPLRLTLVAYPKVLAWLFSRMVFLADEWCFDLSYHVLSLSRDRRQPLDVNVPTPPDASDSGSDTTTTSNSTTASNSTVSSYMSRRTHRQTPCTLFTMRPWTSILLNEGSNTRGYKIYDYMVKRPPSILGALLGSEEHPNNTPLIPSSARSLSYICRSPLATHWNMLLRFLPRLDRFYFRVSCHAPDGAHFDIVNPYNERTRLYESLMHAAFGRRMSMGNSSINWRYLKGIESGDVDDGACMVVMDRRGITRRERWGWSLVRAGLLVRDEAVPIPPPGESEEGEDWSDTDSEF